MVQFLGQEVGNAFENCRGVGRRFRFQLEFTDLLSFLLAVEGLQGFSLISFREGIKNPDVKVCGFVTVPGLDVSKRVSLDEQLERARNDSPVKGCSTGSIERFLEIGFIRLAVVSRTSSCSPENREATMKATECMLYSERFSTYTTIRALNHNVNRDHHGTHPYAR